MWPNLAISNSFGPNGFLKSTPGSPRAGSPRPSSPRPTHSLGIPALVSDQYGYSVQKEVKLRDVPDSGERRKTGPTWNVHESIAESRAYVIILKIFSPKNSAKKLVFLTQNKAKLWSWHWFLRKTPIFSPKIAENCDHNIDPRTWQVLDTKLIKFEGNTRSTDFRNTSVREVGIRQYVVFVYSENVSFDKFTFGNSDLDMKR
jgi:hypothetical protein